MFKTREEVLNWLRENPGKELVTRFGVDHRWVPGDGPMRYVGSGEWAPATVDGPPDSYRITFQPERFGPWETVETWGEASQIGCSSDGRKARAMLCVAPTGGWWLERSFGPRSLPSDQRWARFVGGDK